MIHSAIYKSVISVLARHFKTVQALIFGMLISHNLEKKARLEKIRFPEKKNHRIGDLLKLLKVVMYFLYLLNMEYISIAFIVYQWLLSDLDHFGSTSLPIAAPLYNALGWWGEFPIIAMYGCRNFHPVLSCSSLQSLLFSRRHLSWTWTC